MADDAPDAAPDETPTDETPTGDASVPRPRERELPRGCNPFVFGIVAATIEMGVLLYFMQSC